MPHPVKQSVQKGEDHESLQVPYTIVSSTFAERNDRIEKDGLGS
jgi:hypothetical protein